MRSRISVIGIVCPRCGFGNAFAPPGVGFIHKYKAVSAKCKRNSEERAKKLRFFRRGSVREDRKSDQERKRNADRIASSEGGISPEKRRTESSTALITDSAESVGAASSAV